jgi:release factor glutamine methyltransferase
MSKKKQEPIEEIECEMSSGNVFADIGIENPEEELIKAKLVWEIEQNSSIRTNAEIVLQAIKQCRENLKEQDIAEILGLGFEQSVEVFPPAFFACSEFFASNFPYTKDKHLWEVGCGAGVVSVIAALRYGNTVVATDITSHTIEMTKINAKRHGVSEQIDCRQGSLFAPIEKSEKFDYIYWNWPYGYVTAIQSTLNDFEKAFVDPGYHMIEKFLARCKYYLKPEGSVILSFGSLGNQELFDTLIKKNSLIHKSLAETVLQNGKTYSLYQISINSNSL